ncbi:hypothetical protein FJY84_02740 [Candidatus Bathyarchaeota archaeon]|nr:hypothetical protein [Candidatus Bathyarchaeota archaeon]
MLLNQKKLQWINPHSQTAKDSIFVFGSNIVKLGLGFFINLVLAKKLGASSFGILTLLMNFFLTLSAISELGLNSSLIKLFVQKKGQGESSAIVFLETIYGLRVILSISFFVFFLIAAIVLRDKFFTEGIAERTIFIASTVIFVDCIFNFMLAVLQSQQKFIKLSLVNSGFNFFRLIIVLILFLNNFLDVDTAISSFVLSSSIAIVIGFSREGLNAISLSLKKIKLFLPEIFFWGKWLLITTLANTLFVKLDIILLGFYKIDNAAMGNYSLAVTFAWVIIVFQMGINVLLLPKVSGINHKHEFINYVKKSLVLVSIFILIVITYILFGYFFVDYVFRSQYGETPILFVILSIAFASGMLIAPINLLAFAVDKPQITAFNNIFGIILLLISSYFLIPIYGIYGCAVSVLFSRICTEGVTFCAVLIYSKKKFFI